MIVMQLIYTGSAAILYCKSQHQQLILRMKQESKFISKSLSDQFCMGIISSIIDGPKTAVEIAKKTSIPISTVYRRLQFLQENKMLKTSGGLNKDGKYFVYLSKLKAASTFFDGSEIWVSVTPNLNFTIN